jgi:two-component system, OmpR family, response regulator VicR
MYRQRPANKLIQVGNLVLDMWNCTLKKGATAIRLNPKETKIMALLMTNVDQIVSRDKLIKEVWHTDDLGVSRTLDVYICWLRQKIEDDPNIPEYILTRRTLGYELRLKDKMQQAG